MECAAASSSRGLKKKSNWKNSSWVTDKSPQGGGGGTSLLVSVRIFVPFLVLTVGQGDRWLSFFFLFLCVSVFTQTDGHTHDRRGLFKGLILLGRLFFWLLSHLTVLWVPPFFLLATEEITTIRIPPALSIKPNRKINKVSIYFLVRGK